MLILIQETQTLLVVFWTSQSFWRQMTNDILAQVHHPVVLRQWYEWTIQLIFFYFLSTRMHIWNGHLQCLPNHHTDFTIFRVSLFLPTYEKGQLEATRISYKDKHLNPKMQYHILEGCRYINATNKNLNDIALAWKMTYNISIQLSYLIFAKIKEIWRMILSF